MGRKIRKVAVLGAGVMGSAIAAHLANVGVPSLLLDIVPPFLSDEEKKDKAKRNMFADGAMAAMLKAKPAALYTAGMSKLITTGNMEDDFDKVKDCDWIIEVVKEDLKIKQGLFARLDGVRAEDAIVTSNTSGLAIAKMVEGRTEGFKKHFFVTHFFNPVRYMKLLELVVGEETDPEIVKFIADFGEKVLGKGIVYGKDTPNFIANRIGVHAMMVAVQEMMSMGLTVEDVDAVAGVPMGRPRSAAFKTVDMVGIDTFAHVSETVYNDCPDDEERDVFIVPEFVKKMIENKWLGNKTKGGFYKKTKDETGKKLILALDYNTLEYRPKDKPTWASVKAVKDAENVGARIKKLLEQDDKIAEFAWKCIARTLVYCANRMGEIADDVVNMDRGMCWGYNWELGPFQIWDGIGVAESVARMEKDGYKVPENIKTFLAKGEGTFYKFVDGVEYYYDFPTATYKKVPVGEKWMSLEKLRMTGSQLKANDSAVIHDLGDGCLGLELISKMNSVDPDNIAMMWEALELLEGSKYNGLVIYNEGANFSVGANLMLINMFSNQKKWGDIENMVDSFQRVNTAMHLSSKPVVAAPHQMALGGGCEICLGASHILAHAELYMGLVEVGVGLIPGGGGCKEMLVRWSEAMPDGIELSPLPFVQKAFEIIGMANVSFSAELAKELRFLRPGYDNYVTSRDNQLAYAKNLALGLYHGGYQPKPKKTIKVAGRDGMANINAGLHSFVLSGFVTEYESFIAKKLAYVLCGGDVAPGTLVHEDKIIEYEKEAFMSLVGEKKTQERIRHMLLKNKPLRN